MNPRSLHHPAPHFCSHFRRALGLCSSVALVIAMFVGVSHHLGFLY